MAPPKQAYNPPPSFPGLAVKEEQLEYGFIGKLQGLKYEYRSDIRDRASLERNFREKFEALNRVHLSDGEFARRKGGPLYKLYILSSKSGDLELENCRNDVFLYHLRLLQVLSLAREARDVRAYHFALLRQVLENVASFLGVGQFSYVLNQIGIREPNRIADIVNALSHKKFYYYESDIVVPDNLAIFEEVMAGLLAKYNFVLHAE